MLDYTQAAVPSGGATPTLARKSRGEGLPLEKLERFLYDIRDEPRWRREADRAADYYDGLQLDAETLAAMKDRGIPPLSRNLIGPTVDVVLGMEAKNRRDWTVSGDTDADQDVADVLNLQMKRAERSSGADRACSDAYASQIKSGLGWVEVGRNPDPFSYPYRLRSVHRREIYWDWRAREPDLSVARYLVRRQWFDQDVVEALFPDRAELIRMACSGWANWDPAIWGDNALALSQAFEDEARCSIEALEWRDSLRRRLCLYEVWYRTWVTALTLRLPTGLVIEYDRKNPRHAAALATGMAMAQLAPLVKVRLSWWLGPHQLADIPSPHPHNRFPYVPFWGYREDRTSIPYGLVRRMMSPQDEVNARLSKMMWLLSAKRIVMDDDALSPEMTFDRLMEEAGRADAVMLMNPNRMNRTADAFRVEADRDLSRQQFDVLQDATRSIQDTAGVYQALLGKESQGADSGIAIASLVEQGATTLAGINENYRFARQQVGELLLSMVKEDLAARGEQTFEVERSGRKVPITINRLLTDENGMTYRSNDIARTKAQMELTDVVDTPSYRAQQFKLLTEMTKSLPPEIQVAVVDLIFKASDLQIRHEVVDRISRITGFGAKADDPENAAAKQAKDDQQALANEKLRLEIEELRAKVDKLRAEGTTKNIEGQYSAVQAANTIAMNPAAAPLADTLLKSAGYVDHDAPPIVPSPAPGTPAVPMPQNTNPLTPANAGVGLTAGMETPELGQ
ncbi:MAG: portal protein [Gammaproteobacteria bacterium]